MKYKGAVARYDSELETGEGKKELLARATADENKRDHALRQDPYSVERAQGYITASGRIDEATQTKLVGMLVTLLQSPEYLESVRAWHGERIGRFDVGSDAECRARTAFFAAEGAFFLRSLGMVEMDQAGWNSVFDDILKLVRPTPFAHG